MVTEQVADGMRLLLLACRRGDMVVRVRQAGKPGRSISGDERGGQHDVGELDVGELEGTERNEAPELLRSPEPDGKRDQAMLHVANNDKGSAQLARPLLVAHGSSGSSRRTSRRIAR